MCLKQYVYIQKWLHKCLLSVRKTYPTDVKTKLNYEQK